MFIARLVLLCCLLLAPFHPALAESTPPTAARSGGTVAAVEKRIHGRINVVRREHGLSPLTLNPALSDIARAHSRRMSRERFFSHTDPQRGQVDRRLRAGGLTYRLAGENIFRSENIPDPVDAAVRGWMNSPGHRANILREDFTETGLGVWREGPVIHITQIFRRPL